MNNLVRRGGHLLRWPVLLLCCVGGPALAATIAVTNTNDAGAGSLRQAMLTAIASPEADTVMFAPSANGVITLASALPELLSTGGALTIAGNGAANTIIDGAAAFRPFSGNDAALIFGLRDLTVRNGRAHDAGHGGAIRFIGATLTIDAVEFHGNSTATGGGSGGAIFATATTVRIENSAFHGNSAAWDGSAIGINGGGDVDISNSTFLGDGGASSRTIFIMGNTRTRLMNTTVNAAGGSMGIAQSGGAISLGNCLLTGASTDLFVGSIGTFDSIGSRGNVIGSANVAVAGGASWDGSNQIGVSNPLLGAIGNYGGPTSTMPLLPGSPAIDAGVSIGATGSNLPTPVNDQRGVVRTSVVDAGAFESRGFGLSAASGGGQSTTIGTAFAAPLRVNVIPNNSAEPVAGGVVRFTAPASGASATFASPNASIGADGGAQTTVAANLVAGGPYIVQARIVSGISTALATLDFPLTNLGGVCSGFAFPYTLSGTDNTARVTELRQAIECANANATDDVIDLNGNTLNFVDAPFTDPPYAAKNALPSISSTLTLRHGQLVRDAAAATQFRFVSVLDAGNLTVLDMGLSGGNATSGGGAIHAWGPLTLRRTLFENNLNAVVAQHLTVLESSFVGTLGGAAIWAGRQAPTGTQPVIILNSRFEGYGDASQPEARVITLATTGQQRLENLLFVRNTISSGLVAVSTAATASNLTIADSDLGTAGVFRGPLTVRNSIVWGNQGTNFGVGTVFHHSIVQGGFPAGTGNIDLDPGFTDAANHDYTLGDGSPAIDAGDNALVGQDTYDLDGDANTTEDLPDLAGNPRRYDDATVIDTGAGTNPLVDMGAFERQTGSAPAGITINPISGLVTGEDGSSDTFTVVLDRYPAANVTITLSSSDTSEGTISPASLVFTSANWNTPQTVTVTGVDDALVDGDIGYSIITAAAVSTKPAYNGINPPDVSVINIDDEISPCVDFAFPYTLSGTDNAARVAELRQAIECANASISDDVIDLGGNTLIFSDGPYTSTALPVITSTIELRNGELERQASAPAFRFIYVDSSAGMLTVRGMALRGGSASGKTPGGAILANGPYVDSNVLTLIDSVFENNTAEVGGAVASWHRVEVHNSRFTGNAAVSGAAIAAEQLILIMTSRFEGNGDENSKSVLSSSYYTGILNSLFADNHLTAAQSSLMYFGDSTVAEFRNVTIAGNTVQGELLSRTSGNVQVRNSIVWDNQYGSLGNVSPIYSILPGLGGVSGNLDQPPGFVGPNDYRLDAGSPAIDAGDNNYGSVADLDLNLRPLDDAGVADTGNGTAPIIDIGAYEYQSNSVGAGITITPTTGLVTTEAGGSDTFTVVLHRYPTADVTLALSSSDSTEGMVVPASLSFTQANWNQPQTVTIVGLADGVIDGNQSYTIVTGPASSADPAYAGIDPPDVSVVNEEEAIPPHQLGGTVIGLLGSGLVLALDDGAELLPIAATGSFTFATMLAFGEAYSVTIAIQPQAPAQACVVINGNGTMAGDDVGDVVVNCGSSVTYAVGGTVSGLVGGGLTLQLNGGGDLPLSADGSYAFLPRLVDGAAYVVTVSTQPQGQLCTLANATGTISGADISNVNLSCAPLQANLQLSVDDGRAFARYGHVRDYFVTLGNTGNFAATDVAISATFSTAFDVPNVHWQCIGGGTNCSASGNGGFSDTANVPANSSLTWIVSVPVLAGSNEPDATLTIGQSAPTGVGLPDVSDTNTLVIFRDGFDVPYADGTQALDDIERLGLPNEHSVLIEWSPARDEGIHITRALQTPHGIVDVQRLTWRGAEFVRLLGSDASGQQRISEWAAMTAGAELVVGFVGDAENVGIVLLEGAARPLTLSLSDSRNNGEIE